MGNTHGLQGSDASRWIAGNASKVDGSVEYAALEEILHNVRSDRVRQEFFKIPEGSYTEMNEVRVWTSTFNLNGKKPPRDLNLGELLKQWESRWPAREKEMEEGMDQRADIYLMGFQEAVPLTAQNVIAGWAQTPGGWDRAIDRALNPWKKESQIAQATSLGQESKEASLIDYYVSGWSGIPSGNLTAAVKQSLAEGEKPEVRRSGGSFRVEKERPEKEASPAWGRADAFSAGDLITFDPAKSVANKSSASIEGGASRGMPSAEGRKQHGEEFLQLFRHQLVGLYVTGWVRESFLKRISGVQITTVATGALGYLANKGAISVRFRIDDSAFVFVTSHLASGSHEGDQLRRNLDFSEIMRRTQFPHEVSLATLMRDDGTLVEDFSVRPEGIPDGAGYNVKRAFVGGKWGSVRNLMDLDNIIWVGDLNYRINGRPKEVIQCIRSDKLAYLLDLDQLSIERAAGRAFQGFTEAPIDFPPTYKFVRGTDSYTGEIDQASSSDSDEDAADFVQMASDVSSHPLREDSFETGSCPLQPSAQNSHSLQPYPVPPRVASEGDVPVLHKKDEKSKPKAKKIRTPAWTDRILWYSSKRQLHQLLYGSFHDIHVSDHKPVLSSFLLEARKFDLKKIEDALQTARRSIDVEEMASIPRCKLFPTVIETGRLYYGKPKEFTVSLQNTGEVPAVYSFIPVNPGRTAARSPFPKWLTAQPTSGVVSPGKKDLIQLTVSIEGGQWGSAEDLFGEPDDKLDQILVIHVEGGSDFFVSIMGDYSLSCFGISLKNLAVHVPQKEEKLHRGVVGNKGRLPSLQYRESQTQFAGWEVPVREDMEFDLDDHAVHRPSESVGSLHHSSSIAATGWGCSSSWGAVCLGPQPNLLEGPTGLMIPSQISRMLYFLALEDRLKTPHLFVESFAQICKTLGSRTPFPVVVGIRDALDQAVKFPAGTTAHDMAAALLCLFLELPSPMIPESIAQQCEVSDISAILVMNLVKEAMSAVEWSVFDSTLEIMRSALMDENAKHNQLTEEALAGVLTQVFFQDIRPTGPSKGARPGEATPSKMELVENRRVIFMRQFLKLDRPLIDLDDRAASVSDTSRRST